MFHWILPLPPPPFTERIVTFGSVFTQPFRLLWECFRRHNGPSTIKGRFGIVSPFLVMNVQTVVKEGGAWFMKLWAIQAAKLDMC